MSLLTLERNSPSPQDSDAEETLSSSSHEGFVAREHYVTSLPPRPWASLGRHGGEQLRIFTHLKKVLKLLRSSDTIKLAVELENSFPRKVTKYLVLIATNGYQDTEEAIVLGTEQEDSIIRLGLVLPLWTDTEIKLDGDGGFSVHTGDRQAVFKPSSVQSMWTTLQTLYQATENARQHNYYVGGLSHTWMTYYQSHCTDDYIVRNEWNLTKDVESFRPDSPLYTSQITTQAGNKFEKLLVTKLREVMLHEDLEEVTSRQLRMKLEEETGMQLNDYREFLDRQMLRILGQMEQPSQILDYLYLGTEWNASNLNELKALGVGYILNITREIDNFYPEVFKYLNIRLYDVPDSELIKHWDKSYRFIKEAKVVGTKVLVHCKMGISRSAATVLAYIMKEYHMTLVEAKRHVKGIRTCINPNEGFMTQLKAYEGILTARNNPRWGCHAPSRLSYRRLNRSMSDPDLLQSIEKETLERGDLEREEKEHRELEKEWAMDDQHRFTHSFEHTRPIHNVVSAANIPSLVHQQHIEEPELTFLPEEEEEEEEEEENEEKCQENHTEEAVASPTNLHKDDPLIHSTPVDKSRNIKNFLASLPPPPLGSTNDDGIGENIPTSNSGSAFSTPMYTPPDEEQIHLHMSAQENVSNLQNEDTRQSPHSCATTEEVCDRESEQQPSSSAGKAVAVGIPPKPAPPPMMTKSSLPPSSVASNIGHQLPQLSTVLSASRSQRSNSLPHTLGGFACKENKKISTISPTSSKTSLSSLTRCSPAVLEEEVEEDGKAEDGPRGETASPLVRGGGEKVGVLLEQPIEMREMDSQSESHMELTLPPERERMTLHRRTKSDTHDTSGPIKTAQISSVPERVKEIEERGLQVVSTQQPAVSTDQVDTCVDSASVNDKDSSSVSRSSSEESLPPLQSHTSDKPTSPKHSSLQDPHTRHASLSPNLPSTRTLLQHMPAQTSVSLPTSVSPPEYDSSSPPPALSEEELTSSLHGVVKAKIQDIEGKRSQKSVQRVQQEVSSQKVEAVVRRTSVSTIKRPSSEIIFHNPYIGVVEVNSPSTSDHQVSEPGPKKADTPKARRKGSICNDLFTGRSQKESREDVRVQNEALYNAWAAILPDEHLPIDLASVLELKQRFEVTESPRERRKTPSNLRRSNSLRDTRLLSPPRRLGGSGPGKQYSSNASLLLLGRNSSPEQSTHNSSPSKSPSLHETSD